MQKLIQSLSIRTWVATLFLFLCLPLYAATLLPNGEQVFLDNNGEPLAGGSVYFYIPNTTTLKTTYLNPTQTLVNTNPVILSSAGRATIYGNGVYRQVLRDNVGNLIWDKLTSDGTASSIPIWGGTSSGTANQQVVVAPGYASIAGQTISFIAGLTNTASMVINPGTGNVIVVKDTPAGPIALSGGEVRAGNLIQIVYDPSMGVFHLQATYIPTTEQFTSLASATTTSLGTITSHNVAITGSTNIASFGASASTDFPLYFIRFSDVLTITHNTLAITIPGGANVTTAAGDYALAVFTGGSTWKIAAYFRASGQPLFNVPIANATSGAAGLMSAADKTILDGLAPIAGLRNRAYAAYTTNTGVTGTIPFDGTQPLIAEGVQILSASLTPTSATGRVRVRFTGSMGTVDTSKKVAVVLWRGSTFANVAFAAIDAAVSPVNIAFEWEDLPASTSAQVYTIRVGSADGSVVFVNTTGDGNYPSGASATLVVEQVTD